MTCRVFLMAGEYLYWPPLAAMSFRPPIVWVPMLTWETNDAVVRSKPVPSYLLTEERSLLVFWYFMLGTWVDACLTVAMAVAVRLGMVAPTSWGEYGPTGAT